MTPVKLKKALHDSGPVFGTLIVSPSPFWPKVLGNCGLDFVFIDTEHIALDRSQISWMCRTYTAMGLPPLVRTLSPSPYEATMVLDDGAAGVIAPYIEQVEQVEQLRGASKLRPLKGKRLDDTLAGQPLPGQLTDYVPDFNQDNLLIINIESMPAVENLDRILDVPGIDSVLIGPHDLSSNLGVPEEYDNPTFLKTAETIFTKARQKRVGAGIHAWGDVASQARFVNMGANLIIHKADIIFFKNGIRSELAEIRESLGLKTDDNTDGEVNI
jgi:2-keto-3-deoxy-L-rhamnonate aldolase RhmA